MRSDKYIMFRNFLYNELGITKQDIREWTKEAVFEVADKYIKNSFSYGKFEMWLERVLRERYSGEFKKDIMKGVAMELSKHLEINLKERKKKNGRSVEK